MQLRRSCSRSFKLQTSFSISSVTTNITTCLDSYQEACTASGNADASLRNNLVGLCSGNDVAGKHLKTVICDFYFTNQKFMLGFGRLIFLISIK